jgi:hypothetical protein
MRSGTPLLKAMPTAAAADPDAAKRLDALPHNAPPGAGTPLPCARPHLVATSRYLSKLRARMQMRTIVHAGQAA